MAPVSGVSRASETHSPGLMCYSQSVEATACSLSPWGPQRTALPQATSGTAAPPPASRGRHATTVCAPRPPEGEALPSPSFCLGAAGPLHTPTLTPPPRPGKPEPGNTAWHLQKAVPLVDVPIVSIKMIDACYKHKEKQPRAVHCAETALFAEGRLGGYSTRSRKLPDPGAGGLSCSGVLLPPRASQGQSAAT